jgi:hypothetical protein
MSHYKFEENDIIYNTIEVNPEFKFFIYNKEVFVHNELLQQNQRTAGIDIKHVPVGFISLYEMNINRSANDLIYPFFTKEGSLTTFKTISTDEFNSDFKYGDTLTGSYHLSSSITREYFAVNHVSSTFAIEDDAGTNDRIRALRNVFDGYSGLSIHHKYTSSLAPNDKRVGVGQSVTAGWDKGVQECSLVSIPSIFFGSAIEKGSVDLRFYVTGTLIGKLRDDKKNGELIQVGPTGSTGSGSVAGLVLYNEGFLFLTGSWDIADGSHQEIYIDGGSNSAPRWIDFAAGANDSRTTALTASSFEVSYRGISKIPVMTLFARAPRGELNHSNNMTYIKSSSLQPYTGSSYYHENESVPIKNIVSGTHTDDTGSFKKQTFISKVGIYDKDKNLIGIAKMATPVLKTEQSDYTFKLKVDF